MTGACIKMKDHSVYEIPPFNRSSIYCTTMLR